jgi:hypothetical protein
MQFLTDCANVAQTIRNNPGLSSRWEIANKCGVPGGRVRACVKAMNRDEAPGGRFEYGRLTPKAGPYAGRQVKGWFAMNVAAHHPVMDQADRHEHEIGRGLVWARAYRIWATHGMTTTSATRVLLSVCRRLGIDSSEVEDAEDIETIIALVLEEAGPLGKAG